MKKQNSVLSIAIFICLVFGPVLLSQNVHSAEKIRDFDGDGKSDFLVRRRNNQTTQLFWWILKSGGGHSVTQWGLEPGNFTTSDVSVDGDFDGDGRTDIAVFRKFVTMLEMPAYFFILRSSDNTVIAQQWGLSEDFPMAQDYDGDGKTDIAVARMNPLVPGGAMTWYMLQSRAGYQSSQIAHCCDPLPGDYDGDGRADFAVAYVEGNTGIYKHYIVMSRTKRAMFRTFGTGSDKFVPADYDGDGKTDLAIWRGFNNNVSGLWQWIKSSDGQIQSTNLGTGVVNGEWLVPADYDGDGKTDPAIFKYGGSQGLPAQFLISGSLRGFYTVQWGLDTDIPQ